MESKTATCETCYVQSHEHAEWINFELFGYLCSACQTLAYQHGRKMQDLRSGCYARGRVDPRTTAHAVQTLDVGENVTLALTRFKAIVETRTHSVILSLDDGRSTVSLTRHEFDELRALCASIEQALANATPSLLAYALSE